jgi:hypothetical protein
MEVKEVEGTEPPKVLPVLDNKEGAIVRAILIIAFGGLLGGFGGALAGAGFGGELGALIGGVLGAIGGAIGGFLAWVSDSVF